LSPRDKNSLTIANKLVYTLQNRCHLHSMVFVSIFCYYENDKQQGLTEYLNPVAVSSEPRNSVRVRFTQVTGNTSRLLGQSKSVALNG